MKILSNNNCWKYWIPIVGLYHFAAAFYFSVFETLSISNVFQSAFGSTLITVSFFMRDHIKRRNVEREIDEIGSE